MLGYGRAENYFADGPCAGKIPGRYANRICKGKAEYAHQQSDGFTAIVERTEYFRTTYNARDFRIIDATCKYAGRYPNKAESDEILRTMFGLVPTHK